MLDADLNLSDRWAQVRERAHRVGLKLPESPESEGTILAGLQSGSRIGFWLMPDNASPGTLESFLTRLVPPEDQAWPYADQATAEARQRGARCQEKDHVKSALHAWLAWQEEPGLPFGTALRARVFHHESEDAVRFVTWFRRLFIET